MEREGRYMPDGTPPGVEAETGGAIVTPLALDQIAKYNEMQPGLGDRLAAMLLGSRAAGRKESSGSDPIEKDLPKYRQYKESDYKDKSEAEKTEAQIRWLEGLMTKFETGSAMELNSYLSSQAQQGERGLIDKITHLNKGAFYYFQTRTSANKALNAPSEIGGSVEGFLQYGQMLGDTELQDTLTQRPQVARAYAKLEARANIHSYDANGKFIKSENPAFADVDQLDKIEASIGNELAGEYVDQQIKDKVITAADKEKCLIQEKEIQLRNVKQAEIIWRIWKRSARQNGLVFKSLEKAKTALRRDGQKAITGNLDEEQYKKLREYLLYLPYLERIKHWETIIALADWGDSLSGPVSEDAIQRLTWGGIYHQKNAQGIEAIRPGIDYDSKDFFSYLVTSKSYLQDPANLRKESWQGANDSAIPFSDPEKEPVSLINEEGRAVIVERQVIKREIPAHENILTHEITPARTEKLIIHPNGVVEIDPNNPFDLSKIKLFMAGGKDYYTGKFTAYYLRYAEEMRKNVMNPEKIGRDPFAKPLESLIGLAEHLDSIDKETEKFLLSERNKGKIYIPGSKEERDAIEKHSQGRRDEGKVYKEDAFNSLMMGMMEFQTTGLEKYNLGGNINLEEVDRTINSFRAQHMLTDDQAEKAKKTMSVLMGYPSNEFLNKLSYSITMMYYRDKPHEAFLIFLLEMLKQGFSDFKG